MTSQVECSGSKRSRLYVWFCHVFEETETSSSWSTGSSEKERSAASKAPTSLQKLEEACFPPLDLFATFVAEGSIFQNTDSFLYCSFKLHSQKSVCWLYKLCMVAHAKQVESMEDLSWSNVYVLTRKHWRACHRFASAARNIPAKQRSEQYVDRLKRIVEWRHISADQVRP